MIKKSFFSAAGVGDYTGKTQNSTTEQETLWFPWTSWLMIHRMWTAKNHSGGSCQKNVNTLHPPKKINGITVSAFQSTLISELKKMVMRPLLILSASCLKVTVVPARHKAGKGSSRSSVGGVGGYLTRLERHGKPSDLKGRKLYLQLE